MKNLFRYLKPFSVLLLITIILILIQTMVNLQLPDYMSKIIDIGVIKGDINYILTIGLLMIGISIIGSIVTIGVSYLSAHIGTSFTRNMRSDIFEKIQSFSLVEFSKFSTSSLITRTTNDINQVQNVVIMFLRMAIAAPITVVGAIFKVLQKSNSMAWIPGLSVAVLFFFIIIIFITVIPKFSILQKLLDKLNLVTREQLSGVRVVRAFNNELYSEQKFNVANRKLMKISSFVNRIGAIGFPLMTLIMSFTTILIVWVGSSKIDSGTLNVGDMMAFIQYATQILFSFLMLSMLFLMVPRATVSLKRINEVLDTKVSIKNKKNTKSFDETLKGQIEFKNVSFKYKDAEDYVLKNISFKANVGEVVAFIGSTGSGKSTLINLIPRFFDTTEGSIIVDGIDIKDADIHELRSKIGYVPQKASLFSGTIESNIKYGNIDATNEELISSSKVAQAYDFITKKDKGFESAISQGGTNVSGGQKQRISIARAVIIKPSIYIFDDSFSALDYKTDKELRNSLKNEIKQSTVLIVAQRINTIKDADKIIVLNKGEIVGIGKHSNLMKKCKVYKEIALSQLSKEELK